MRKELHVRSQCNVNLSRKLQVLGERGPSFYPDAHGAQRLLRYELLNTGCCSILSHPRWGTRVYPATVFAVAPSDVVEAFIREMAEKR